MEYERASSVTFSKKLMMTRGHSFGSKSIYDGVFSDAPPNKLGSSSSSSSSRAEDYSEIFRGSGSSIPLLDVPEIEERRIAVDVKSSKVDYSKIFGGFGDAAFGVSYEELFATSKEEHSTTKEPRNPVETRSSSQASRPSNHSAGNQNFPDEASYKSFNGMKEFKMSYHKTDRGSKIGTNGTTHVAQLNAVPGYAYMVDELQKTEEVKPVSTTQSDNLSGGKTEGNNYGKVMPDLPPNGASRQTSKSSVIYQNKTRRSRSNSIDTLFDSSETVLRTPPSSQLHKSSNNKVEPERSTGSKFGFSKFSSLDSDTMPDSPPYFDEELDVNSVAAASAAAVKKAIEEAQAKLKIAKEMMERKKEGLENHVKLKKSSAKTDGRRQDKIPDERNKLRENGAWEICEDMDTPMQIFSRTVESNVVKAGKMTSNFQNSEELLVTGDAPAEAGWTNFKSTQADLGQEKADECEEVNQEENGNKMKESVTGYGQEKDHIDKKTTEKLECHNKFKADGETPKQGVVARLLDAVKWAYELRDHVKKAGSSLEVHDQEEYNQKSRFAQQEGEIEEELRAFHELEACEGKREEDDQKSRIVQMGKETDEGIARQEAESEQVVTQNEEETEEVLTASHELECKEKMEDNQKLRVAQLEEETKEEPKVFYELETCNEKMKDLPKPIESERKPEISEPKVDEILKRLNDDQECGENEKHRKEAHKVGENDVKSECNRERKESEPNLEEIPREEENAKRHEEASPRMAFEREETETCRLEENNVEQKDVHTTEDIEKMLDKVLGQNMVVETFNNFHDTDESEKSFEKDVELGGNEELIEAEETGNIHQEIYQMKEAEKRHKETSEWVETENLLQEIDQAAEDEKMEVTQEALSCYGNNLAPAHGPFGQDELENQSGTPDVCDLQENTGYEEATSEVHAHEVNDEIREMTEASFKCQKNRNESEEVEMTDILEEMEICEIPGFIQGCLEVNDTEEQVEDTIETQDSDKNKVCIGVTDVNFGRKQHNPHTEDSEVVCNEGKQVDTLACEAEENYEDVEDAKVTIKQEKENKFESSSEERYVGQGRVKEEAQLSTTSEGEVDNIEIPHEIETSLSTENVEDQQEALKTEEKEAGDSWEKEVELEREHLRKIDEEKERVREKEKERIAVERAIREARERAFAEARERAAAERATTEMRRRAMAEGRKASAEANDKSAAEKASIEAKRKAERAAVERATAEARERALEKALSDKAAFQARKQGENSSDKSYGASRDNGTRKHASSNDSQYKNSGSRYPNSYDHSGNGEPAERCKARLERHQRTAERAAKALAEKNMRDLLAQKEQAERDRLADALDGEIKRWSSGKEGNLRALLSTLQYILGPNSGWQPIPLTDLIATTAVRKAYRKATLFVHPDKLQQRGATIQQKYTCEKVFDLLKDAWNKFSIEER